MALEKNFNVVTLPSNNNSNLLEPGGGVQLAVIVLGTGSLSEAPVK